MDPSFHSQIILQFCPSHCNVTVATNSLSFLSNFISLSLCNAVLDVRVDELNFNIFAFPL